MRAQPVTNGTWVAPVMCCCPRIMVFLSLIPQLLGQGGMSAAWLLDYDGEQIVGKYPLPSMDRKGISMLCVECMLRIWFPPLILQGHASKRNTGQLTKRWLRVVCLFLSLDSHALCIILRIIPHTMPLLVSTTGSHWPAAKAPDTSFRKCMGKWHSSDSSSPN